MTTHITLDNDGKVNVKCTMVYSGSEKQGPNVQEVPACFLDARYSLLMYKHKVTGAVITVVPNAPGSKNMQKLANPKWAGYIDPNTGEGVFITSPMATSLTAYRVAIPTNPPTSNCSYLAPLLDRYTIKPGSTIEYVYTVELRRGY
jgi:hypothetical protein